MPLYYSPQTYLALLPIVGGLALVSLKELSFTWKALYGALPAPKRCVKRDDDHKATMYPAGNEYLAGMIAGDGTEDAFKKYTTNMTGKLRRNGIQVCVLAVILRVILRVMRNYV